MKLGDAIEKGIKRTGLDKLAPKDCGCKKRREALNRMDDSVRDFRNKVVNKVLRK